METAGPHFNTGITELSESNSTVTFKLLFSICNAPWMELFIWSCSAEASHCIKTGSRVTRGSYLSLSFPDMFPLKPCTSWKQRITFHSRGILISCRHFWLAPEAGCYDSKAYPRCWKWHRQIITRQYIWQCQHIWLAQTHTHTHAQTHFHLCIFMLPSGPCNDLTWSHLANLNM